MLLRSGQEVVKRFFNVVLADTVDWPMVYEELDKIFSLDVGGGDALVVESFKSDLIDHIFDLLLRWVVAHGTHQVRQLLNGHLAVQNSRLCCVLLL